MNFKRIFVLLAAALMLCVVLTAVACDGGEGAGTQETTQATTEENTTEAPATEQTTEEITTDDGKVTYTVKVVDANGAPVEGVAVQFCDDNGCRMPVATNAEGVVTLTDVESNFHVTLASVPAGFAADTTEYYFDGAVELTITLQAE
ncbi:MAG: hypothetical protein IJW70_00825 [Clostridia bacterium]|nr:hypothetical protein [Clostridia bacterium]